MRIFTFLHFHQCWISVLFLAEMQGAHRRVIDLYYFIFSVLFRYNWPTQWIDSIYLIYCRMITLVALLNTSITSHNYFFCVVQTFRISSFRNIQALTATATVQCVRSPALTYLTTRSLCSLTPVSPFPPPPALGNHRSSLLFLWVWLFYFILFHFSNVFFQLYQTLNIILSSGVQHNGETFM